MDRFIRSFQLPIREMIQRAWACIHGISGDIRQKNLCILCHMVHLNPTADPRDVQLQDKDSERIFHQASVRIPADF